MTGSFTLTSDPLVKTRLMNSTVRLRASEAEPRNGVDSNEDCEAIGLTIGLTEFMDISLAEMIYPMKTRVITAEKINIFRIFRWFSKSWVSYD